MRRRIVALVAALLLAGVGTFVLVGFVRGAEERATAGEELVAVYIVELNVPQGTEGSSMGDYVRVENVPLKVRSADAVTDLSHLADLVNEVSLVPGEQLLASRFVEPAALDQRRDDLPSRRVEVPEGKLELPIRLAAEQALGGIVDAGDTVAIVASFTDYTGSNGEIVEVDDTVIAIPESAEEEPTEQATHILIHNALIVEVQADSAPQFTGGEEEESSGPLLAPATSFIITFALDPADVERLVFAAEYGSLWMAAQTPDDTGPTGIVTMDDIFQG